MTTSRICERSIQLEFLLSHERAEICAQRLGVLERLASDQP
jgi:hypothetical protein